jgi:t-SNARE complex subunit (syntaxin)
VSAQQQAQIGRERTDQVIQDIARRSEVIRNLFADLAQIVADQGPLVDRIDVTLQMALANAQRAHDDVVPASQYQRRSRLWICIVILIVLIVNLFILALSK